MKTEKELQNRYDVLTEKINNKYKMFDTYGNIEAKVNDWKGVIEEGKIINMLNYERDFIEKCIKFLF